MTGLSEDDRALLDKGKVFDAADRSVQSWQDGASALRDGASTLRRTIESYLTAPDPLPTEPEPEILRAAHEEYRLNRN